VLPIIVDPRKIVVGLAGSGEALARRRDHLTEAGVTPVAVANGCSGALTGLDILYVAGAARPAAEALAGHARALGVLVNVEDVPELCDFHVPATVRRGDLLLTASSAGRAPGLVRLVREWLSAQFGPDWVERVAILSRKRADWRARGLPPSVVSAKTRSLAEAWFV